MQDKKNRYFDNVEYRNMHKEKMKHRYIRKTNTCINCNIRFKKNDNNKCENCLKNNIV